VPHESGEPTGNDGRDGPIEAGDLGGAAARRGGSSPIEQGLRRFHVAASAYVGDGSNVEAVRSAIELLAETGRRARARPEELVVMLKHRCSVLFTPDRHAPVDSEQLKEQFVTWLIEAYFGGRAD
jgi:hypothetical protein